MIAAGIAIKRVKAECPYEYQTYPTPTSVTHVLQQPAATESGSMPSTAVSLDIFLVGG